VLGEGADQFDNPLGGVLVAKEVSALAGEELAEAVPTDDVERGGISSEHTDRGQALLPHPSHFLACERVS
jgi:hypothetical protein